MIHQSAQLYRVIGAVMIEPLKRCSVCSAPNPQIGNLMDGVICVDCWKAKHPVTRSKYDNTIDDIISGFVLGTISGFAIILLIVVIIIWEGLNK